MKEYKKPVACSYKVGENILPVAAVAGLSVGSAFAVGVAAGLSKGDIQGASNRCNNIKKVTAF